MFLWSCNDLHDLHIFEIHFSPLHRWSKMITCYELESNIRKYQTQEIAL